MEEQPVTREGRYMSGSDVVYVAVRLLDEMVSDMMTESVFDCLDFEYTGNWLFIALEYLVHEGFAPGLGLKRWFTRRESSWLDVVLFYEYDGRVVAEKVSLVPQSIYVEDLSFVVEYRVEPWVTVKVHERSLDELDVGRRVAFDSDEMWKCWERIREIQDGEGFLERLYRELGW